MDSSFFITILAAPICFFMIFRKLRSHQENQEIDSSSSSSLSPSSVPPSIPSPSSVPPSYSSHNWTHEVFPSFRGEDVRGDFLSHIKKEFGRKGITPFDDNGIKRGESIGPELIRAIRGSKIAIILLSKTYASSKWCLDELVEIMKCREELGQIVMAIFYKVDPSDVKKLVGDFGKVFRKTCAGKSKEDIGRWRQALEKVATIAGYHSKNWDNEAAMIEKIAMDVSNKLNYYAPSSDFDGFVGMGAHMEKMEPFLLQGSDEVRMIGIWGPSGIGKSTIARVLFNKHSSQFQLSVLMENIKRRYPRPYNDEYSAKLQLQKELLSQLFNQEDIKIQHLGVAQDRLKDKRVLVVLDDVDHLVQLDAMAKETRWFGPGSWIIITTQDIQLLKAHGIDHIYEVGFPPDDEALEIFCMYAFGQKSPYDGFEMLARKVTRLAGRLPLGLKVMGSYLKGRSEQEWRNELPRLRASLDGEMESVLEFSYNALRAEDKALFLYIACFFNNERIEKVEEHLAKSFSNVSQGLQVLAEKSLISISGWELLVEMHDLLARLGREIVGRQAIHDPGQRQFLVNARDICQVLNNDTLGCERVIGIDLKFNEIEDELKISEGAFERMSSLQFLRTHGDYIARISNYALQTSPNYLPPKVRLLHWEYSPMTCLPSNFNPNFLVELNMPHSRLEKLWEGIKTIKKLKWMDLSYSKNLKELPDLSTATNLQKLNLSDCSSLVKLSSSIGNVIYLKELNLSGCSSIVKLPFSIGNVTNLQRLDLRRCSSLVELPSSIGNITNLQRLDLTCCSSLVELPSSIGNVINLKELDLSDCSSLVDLPSSIGNVINLKKLDLSNCSSLVDLPSSIENVINLQKLDLSYCSSLVELPSSIENLHNLSYLLLRGCSKLEALPININMESLDTLDLTDCSSLKTFPEISTKIKSFWICGTAVEEVPSSFRSWSCLEDLEMQYCENLAEFPHAFNYITELHVSNARIQELAPWVKGMSGLVTIVLEGCTKLVSLPELPNSLKILHAKNCESLETLDCSFHNRVFVDLFFINCFKLNQEARDLIIKTSICHYAILPGEKVPTYFTYRNTGSAISVNLNGTDTHFPISLRFKACAFLPANKGGNKSFMDLDCGINVRNGALRIKQSPSVSVKEHRISKINLVNGGELMINPLLSVSVKEHLYIFEFEAEVSSSELVFEFEFSKKFFTSEADISSNKKWEIGECGIRTSATCSKAPKKVVEKKGKTVEAPKLRMQRLVEEADYQATAELFGAKSEEKSIFGAKTEEKSVDMFIPKSESDFLEYAELISHRLIPYEKSFHYIGLLKAVMRLSVANMKAADVKDVASSITAIANEKLKAEKEAAGKKKTGKKKQLQVDKPDDDLVAGPYDAMDDDDFM